MKKQGKTILWLSVLICLTIAIIEWSLMSAPYIGPVLAIIIMFVWTTAISILVSFIIYFILRKRKSFLIIWAFSLLAIYTISILALEIDRYKPTAKIHVPENLEGEVTIFRSTLKEDSLVIGSNGIGYLSEESWYGHKIKVYRDGKNISEILDDSGSGVINFYNSDSSAIDNISFFCFELNEEDDYPKRGYTTFKICEIDNESYYEMCNQGIIDSTIIKVTHYDLR